MKSIYTVVFIALLGCMSASAQTITTSGFTFTPDSLAVHVGDLVTFNVDFSTHPLHEVSSSTWAANGSTQLSGGFSATSGTTFSVSMTAAGIRYYVCANHVSLGMKGRIFVSNPNGIESISSVAAATYPNPANNQLHIISNSTGDMHCALTNMLGQAVLEKDASVTPGGVVTLDISSVTEGVYILSTNTNGTVHTSKVQITH